MKHVGVVYYEFMDHHVIVAIYSSEEKAKGNIGYHNRKGGKCNYKKMEVE